MQAPTLGIHALVWTGDWNEGRARYAAERTRACGYDRLEIPLLDSWHIDAPSTRRIMAEHGLAVTGNLFHTRDTDITSEDPAAVAAGERRLRQGVELVRDMGGDRLCGTIYSMLGKYDRPPTARGRAQSAEVLRRTADLAADAGVRLGLETCNRYETNLVNTAAQALALAEEIDRPNVDVHLDTYHLNIEEPDTAHPVLVAGDRLGYVHVGESNRGYLGSGDIDFAGFFRALHRAGYTGPIIFESFSSAVIAPELSNALCIWRDPWDDSDDLAGHAQRFITEQLYSAALESPPAVAAHS
ncbi:sugar phosphate isomerase/epimerase family protein [Actinomadura latina]|uniref:Sugar phosphate isomerase/epimerase n=1 Tax=Actinomadura latina TaxID=163603 RepID=A0A846Z296_9ACTN|nr:sugar phosphate isomerase/epimerase family protein [Actinomadura latina]NKZ07049.1 sugar phosphate isomerase/epimerase [Actinomadura latina]